MFTTEASALSTASPDAIFAHYTDVANWHDWDAGLERVTLDGPFAAGTAGTLQPTGGPVARFQLTQVVPGVGFSDRTVIPHPLLPLAIIEGVHELTVTPEGTRITHRMTGRGLFGGLIARGSAKDLPDTGVSLAAHAAKAR